MLSVEVSGVGYAISVTSIAIGEALQKECFAPVSTSRCINMRETYREVGNFGVGSKYANQIRPWFCCHDLTVKVQIQGTYIDNLYKQIHIANGLHKSRSVYGEKLATKNTVHDRQRHGNDMNFLTSFFML